MGAEDVSPEEGLDEKPVSGEEPKGDEPKGDEPKPELTEERVQQLIAEATATAVAKAEDAGRRNLQSEQDRNKNAEKRARLAESKVTGYEVGLSGLDEETRNAIELAKYREQDKYSQSTAQDEVQRQQDADFWGRVNSQVLTNLDNLGIARDDKRIDWGEGSKDLPEARNRLDASVAKILNENKKVTEDKMKDDFKNLESTLRKELNLDTVDTTAGSGGGSDSDADFKKGIGDGSLPLNKVNMARAKKLGLAK
ncbi:hypothetical protein LCGC14_0488890 [marine sediment metagenome]|uniref:Scaffolding protein n=1 Tax=marine sediment metagenome TaxID=412755 RepID=A0A0F9SQI4_9ZZZZ